MQKKNLTPEKIETLIFSPAGLLALAGVALLCVMGCAVAMAVLLAPGLASTRAQILQANERRVANERAAAATPSPAPTIIAGTAVAQPVAGLTPQVISPTRTGLPGVVATATPLSAPTARVSQPAPPTSVPLPTSVAPIAPTATQPGIAATNPVVLPPTFTAFPSPTLPGAIVSPTLTPTPGSLPSATPTNQVAATETPVPATSTPTATPPVAATSVITKPGATLVDGTITISAVSKNIDYPSSEYIELTNVGTQNVSLSNWSLFLRDEPPVAFTFNGVVLEPNLTCRIFTGAGASGTGGGTSNACSGLSFNKNASLFQIPRRVELMEVVNGTNLKLKAVYIYTP